MTETIEENKAILLQFNIKQTLQIHLTKLKVYTYSNKEAKPYHCHLCDYSSKFKSYVKQHLLSHSREKPFACTLCNYKSSRKGDVQRHIMTHTGEKHYSCAFCNKAFITNPYKLCHEKMCKLNPKQNDPSWVEMQTAFKCKLCPYSSPYSSNLKLHVMTHTGEKPFACTLCNHKCRSRPDLRKHIFTHTREKPHNCQFCKREFSRDANHKIHEKICKLNPQQGDAKWVEEQKKFKCQLCNYRTTAKWSLECHLRSHTGEKPYSCPLCLYKCGQNSSLHQHLRNMHAMGSGFKCPECDFTTLSTSKLLNHVKEFHLKV